jgi:hypothetical protein
VPTPQAIGIWLRRLGKDNQGIKALQKVNKTVQRLPLVVLIYKNIFKRLTHLCSDTKFNIMFKAIINNTGLIACSNNSTQASEQITTGQYIYRSIATNLETLSDSKVKSLVCHVEVL